MEEIDLMELINIFWNKKVFIILVTIIFIIAGVIYTLAFTTPMYSSSTTLVLAMSSESDDSNSITTTDITLNSNLVSTYSQIIESNEVLREVISNLKIDEDEEVLRKSIDVSSVEDTEVIEITVSHESAVYAARIANEIANVFSNKVQEIYNINNVYVLDEAEIENEPSNINHIRDVLIFAIAGILLSMVYVFITSILDNTIKTEDDIEKGYNIHVLVSIPDIENFDAQRGGRR